MIKKRALWMLALGQRKNFTESYKFEEGVMSLGEIFPTYRATIRNIQLVLTKELKRERNGKSFLSYKLFISDKEKFVLAIFRGWIICQLYKYALKGSIRRIRTNSKIKRMEEERFIKAIRRLGAKIT